MPVRKPMKKAAAAKKAAPAKRMNLRAGQVDSIDRLRNDLKKGSGGAFFYRPKPNEDLEIRFLTEPDEWLEFEQHYNPTSRSYFPCRMDDCPGCDADLQASKKYVANVLNISTGQVIALMMAKTLARQILKRYDKFSTLLDRDYIISRTGSGKDDTEYDAMPDKVVRRDIEGQELLDLHEMLEQMALDAEDAAKKKSGKTPTPDREDDEELDSVLSPVHRARGQAAKKAIAAKAKRHRPALEDDDDEEDGYTPPRRAVPRKLALKKAAREAGHKPMRRA